jgi:hypothetical protein
MNCDEVIDRLQESLDAGSLPEEARAHLAACRACGARAARLSEVHGALDDEPAIEWSGALTAGVLARVDREDRRGRRFSLAAAAVLVIATVFGVMAVPDAPGLPSLADLPAEAGEALSALAGGGAPAGVDGILPFAFLVPLVLALLELLRLAVARRSEA